MRRENTPERGCIASYVGPHALAPHTRAALEGLGYSVVQAFSMGRFEDTSWMPVIRMVDERHLLKVPAADDDPNTPIIVLTGTRPKEIHDDRVAGHVSRPAQLSDIYRILQQSLEATPRGSPRVETLLSARCSRADHRWVGNVVSLSEGGCLFRSAERVEVGESMNLEFSLPKDGVVCTRAVAVYELCGEVGMVFANPNPTTRQSIRDFVVRRLATL
jgi:hypothetical protein